MLIRLDQRPPEDSSWAVPLAGSARHRAGAREGLWQEGQGGWRLHPCSSCCHNKAQAAWPIIPASFSIHHSRSTHPLQDTLTREHTRWAHNTPTCPSHACIRAQTPLSCRDPASPQYVGSQWKVSSPTRPHSHTCDLGMSTLPFQASVSLSVKWPYQAGWIQCALLALMFPADPPPTVSVNKCLLNK